MRRKKNKLKQILITSKDIFIKIASKKTFWLFFITFITSCGLDLENDAKDYIKDGGQLIFQFLGRIL